MVPVGGGSDFGVSLDGRTATAVALDEEGKEIGPAKTRLSRGLVYVEPVEKAFSYVLTPEAAHGLARMRSDERGAGRSRYDCRCDGRMLRFHPMHGRALGCGSSTTGRGSIS